MDKELIKQMLDEERISFEKPFVILYITGHKDGAPPVGHKAVICPALEPTDFGVN